MPQGTLVERIRTGGAGPAFDTPAVYGADLVHGAEQVFVIPEHVARDGKLKLVDRYTFPPTGVGCTTRVCTSHAVIDIANGRFVLRETLAAMSM